MRTVLQFFCKRPWHILAERFGVTASLSFEIQILDHDSMFLGTFENADFCNQQSRLACNFYLCPQTIGKMGFSSLSETHNLSLVIYCCGQTPFFTNKKWKTVPLLASRRRPESFWKLLGGLSTHLLMPEHTSDWLLPIFFGILSGVWAWVGMTVLVFVFQSFKTSLSKEDTGFAFRAVFSWFFSETFRTLNTQDSRSSDCITF